MRIGVRVAGSLSLDFLGEGEAGFAKVGWVFEFDFAFGKRDCDGLILSLGFFGKFLEWLIHEMGEG